MTQIVRNESVRFQDFALCAKCLCAALAASQRGCIRFGNGFIPPSRFWPNSGAYQYRSPPTKAALLREPYDLTQIVRNESVRFQDFALCAKCLCAALAASQRGCIRFGNGFIPPSRFWPNSGAYQYRSRAGEPHNRQRAARAPRPKRAVQPGGSPAQL